MQDRTRELERARAQAVVLAERDQLTGLPNRMSFRRVFARAADGARQKGMRVGLLLIDIDGFKEINDTLGHEAGDTFLRDVAERLDACLRPGSFAARLGGDEFAVVAEGVDAAEDLTAAGSSGRPAPSASRSIPTTGATSPTSSATPTSRSTVRNHSGARAGRPSTPP